MPSGRDSFRRNRVAPIGYSVLLLRFVLRLATGLLYHPRQGGCGLSREDVSECGGQAYFAARGEAKERGLCDKSKRGFSTAWRGSFARANEKEKATPLHSE
jgi:hypothetical protein